MLIAMTSALAQYLAHVSALPFVRRARLVAPPRDRAADVDAVLRVVTPTGPIDFDVQVVRSHLTGAGAQHLQLMARERPNLVVFAPHVGRELGEQLTVAGVQFVDRAGNCHVRVGDQYLARVQGQRAERVATVDKALRGPAYRVLFALVAQPDLLSVPLRALAQAAGGVSPQTARDLRDRLVTQGMALTTAKSLRWAPGGLRGARDLWVTGHATTLFPSLSLGRFRARESDVDALEARLSPLLDAAGPWRWGGAAASARLTGYYRGTRTLVYFDQNPGELARRFALVPDADGPVVFAVSPGPLAFTGPNSTSVHPLLAYADLLLEGTDRAREAARELVDEHRAYFQEAP